MSPGALPRRSSLRSVPRAPARGRPPRSPVGGSAPARAPAGTGCRPRRRRPAAPWLKVRSLPCSHFMPPMIRRSAHPAGVGRAALLTFDAVQRLPLRRRRVGCGQVDAGGKLEPQIRLAIDAKFAVSQQELEDVAAGAPVRGYEVEVVAGDVQALGVAGEAEADEAARDVVELEGGLMFDDLREGRVGPALAGYAARLDVVEVPLDPDSVARSLAADEPVQARTEL